MVQKSFRAPKVQSEEDRDGCSIKELIIRALNDKELRKKRTVTLLYESTMNSKFQNKSLNSGAYYFFGGNFNSQLL